MALVLMGLAASASAGNSTPERCVHFLFWDICVAQGWGPTPTPVNAPEIDPASAISGLTLLAGALAVLRGRRRTTKP